MTLANNPSIDPTMNTHTFSSLPASGKPLADGTFIGVTTLPDGTHAAVVLLDDRPEKRLTWQAAMDWAAGLDAQLPTRPIAALLYANARDRFERSWHWTSDAHEEYASSAWYCYFTSGDQTLTHESFVACARAVRLIHLSA